MKPITIEPAALLPGDVLLYNSHGVFGWVIRFKTWHSTTHVEVYMGAGMSAASRDGEGVNMYPLRTKGLVAVMRPEKAFTVISAMQVVNKMIGTPYGWTDLLAFVGVKHDGRGIVCSPFATLVLRAGGIPVFNDEEPNNVAPFFFLNSEELTRIA